MRLKCFYPTKISVRLIHYLLSELCINPYDVLRSYWSAFIKMDRPSTIMQTWVDILAKSVNIWNRHSIYATQGSAWKKKWDIVCVKRWAKKVQGSRGHRFSSAAQRCCTGEDSKKEREKKGRCRFAMRINKCADGIHHCKKAMSHCSIGICRQYLIKE